MTAHRHSVVISETYDAQMTAQRDGTTLAAAGINGLGERWPFRHALSSTTDLTCPPLTALLREPSLCRNFDDGVSRDGGERKTATISDDPVA
jgi:hypothetical protein